VTDQPAHLSWASLSSAPDPVEAWLDEVELGRVDALTRAEDRLRFRLSRALLRSLVGELSGVAAASVRLSYACARCGRPHGRPVVVAPEPARRWWVSIAHAGDRVVVAASAVGPVGVDVESVAAVGFGGVGGAGGVGGIGGFDGVALTAAERADLATVPPDRQVAARAALWVAKEAILKAGGEGLRVDPASVNVASWPGVVVPVDVGPGYAAAAAVTLGAPTSGGTPAQHRFALHSQQT
jgi:4'-phosphopantetheinyl transferase